jgi:hypothetical protein
VIPQVFLLLLLFLFLVIFGAFSWYFRSSLDSSIRGRFSPDFFEGIMGECLVPLCG